MAIKALRNLSSGFVVNDEQTDVIVPDTFGNKKLKLDENNTSGALRYRGTTLGGNAFGLVGTFRTGDGYHYYLAAADGIWEINDDNKVRFQLSGSHSEYPVRFAEDVCESGDCLGEGYPEDPEYCPTGDCSLNAQVLRLDPGETLTGHRINMRYENNTDKGDFFLD